MAGLLAALWLLGLFAAAPVLRSRSRDDVVDRLRDALILGIAIPFALALLHALYPLACWCALAICIGLAYRRRPMESDLRDRGAPIPYLLIGSIVAVTWPQLMRPLLDGDSLSYHLPNAASWVQAHSLWTSATRYWWYPPASEFFAAGLYATGGPFALPWSGFGALALLGLRIWAWAREAYSLPPLLADTLAAATITIYPIAIQGSTLQNDVWLAAFFLESLWVLRTAANATAVRTLATTALIKPQGWILAVLAAAAGRAPRRVWFAAAAAPAIWIVHDAIVWQRSSVEPQNFLAARAFGTTIVAHGVPAFVLLARVLASQSPFASIALLAALLGPVIARKDPRLGWAGCACALLFLFLPFGYATAVAQLATGASLRFAAPAIAVGTIVLAAPLRRAVPLATAALLLSTLYGIWYVLAIFWNDGGTHVAIVLAVLVVAIAALVRSPHVIWLKAVGFGLGVVVAVHLAARHALDYYDDALRVGPASPGVYRWIASNEPPAVGGWGLRLGVVNVLSPSTRTLDLSDTGACLEARRNGVLLVAVAQPDLEPGQNESRLIAAARCGRTLFKDGIGMVTRP
ncbi:MAG: hypothetical protein JOZ77_04905 [Candidatus Eremiobacteraeota bacterium]|nr:hypothetical protein [Candidatus Eremiobacteraeota bacterium]